ncbi:hypothetical protein BB559_004627 [Furculomyces boomerangus]|uniref:UBA domain-containing protein n=1 Tax=Furculomyces boomerangus TaxID=61424 RepID=A0A2T9YDR3_9FUNG|nr:hypothetical protein BB559_004627 [Furculomyces boomerangus]
MNSDSKNDDVFSSLKSLAASAAKNPRPLFNTSHIQPLNSSRNSPLPSNQLPSHFSYNTPQTSSKNNDLFSDLLSLTKTSLTPPKPENSSKPPPTNTHSQTPQPSDIWDFDLLAKPKSSTPSVQPKATQNDLELNTFDPILFKTTTPKPDILPIQNKEFLTPASNNTPLFQWSDSENESLNSKPQNDKNLVSDQKLAAIMQLGFSIEQSIDALSISNGNADAAIQILKEQVSIKPKQKETKDIFSNSLEINQDNYSSDESSNGLPARYEYTSKKTKNTKNPLENFSFTNNNKTDNLFASANEMGSSFLQKATGWLNQGKRIVSDKTSSFTRSSDQTQFGFDKKNNPELGFNSKNINFKKYDSDDDFYSSSSDYKSANTVNDFTRARPVKNNSNVQQTTKPSQLYNSKLDDKPNSSRIVSGNILDKPNPPKNNNILNIKKPIPPKRIDIPNIPKQTFDKAIESKNNANNEYKLGRYDLATQGYTSAIDFFYTAKLHPYKILLLNNRSQTHMKTGELQSCLNDIDSALEIINLYGQDNNSTILELGSDIQIDLLSQQIKLLLRKGQVLENQEKYKAALETYKKLTGIKIGNPTMNKVLSGIKRCDLALGNTPAPSTNPKPTFKTNNASNKNTMFKPVVTSNSNKSTKSPEFIFNSLIKETSANLVQNSMNDEEEMAMRDRVHEKVLKWKVSNQNSIRGLLCTVHQVCGNLVSSEDISLSQVVTDKQVKVVYMRTISKLHPDRLKSNLSNEEKLLASQVFSVLNQAYNQFKV